MWIWKFLNVSSGYFYISSIPVLFGSPSIKSSYREPYGVEIMKGVTSFTCRQIENRGDSAIEVIFTKKYPFYNRWLEQDSGRISFTAVYCGWLQGRILLRLWGMHTRHITHNLCLIAMDWVRSPNIKVLSWFVRKKSALIRSSSAQ